MRVKATNIMSKAIRKEIDLESIGITSVTCRRLTIPEYARYVSCNIYDHEEDFNPASGKMSAILVEYIPEMYAIPRWFTTRDLASAYRDSDRTYDGFFKALAADLEI